MIRLYEVTTRYSILKVAFIQKLPIHLPFPQTDKPYYFLELDLKCLKFKIQAQENIKICFFEEITNASVPSE